MSQKNFYITTPLYYVNAKPHIGHAYTNVLCDCFARHRRFWGEKTFFLTGTDEHGTKIEQAAKNQGMEPKAYVDSMVPQFKALWKKLEVRYDYFIRTTDADHKAVVCRVLSDLEAKGEIYKARYKGWYSIQDETFYTATQVREGFAEGVGGNLIEIEEENYFFKLSRYQSWLIEHIQRHPEFIQPEMRRNEILGFLKEPLEDLCITRPRSRLRWGIDFPSSPDHVTYVWFDALLNYISAVKYALDPDFFRAHWPADLHVIGKDIIRHHAVFWPIMLQACGIELPTTVLAHGWWTMAGAKMSKSKGNIVDPALLSDKYGVDAFRYFLLHEVTLGMDGAYSEDLLRERYTKDLANDLGNLWHRFASMLEKYFDSEIQAQADWTVPLLQQVRKLSAEVDRCLRVHDPRGALDLLWKAITAGNQYVEETKPWVLAKDPKRREELAKVLSNLAEAIAHVAVLLDFFMPQTASRICERMGLLGAGQVATAVTYGEPWIRSGQKVLRGEPLFPKLDDEVPRA
ncbi:MAG: methionine--tRNA ligase [Candidatus Omnitrophota bacterium]